MAAPLWRAVGGADRGGLLVREAADLASPLLKERLSTGALVREVELVGDRLHYELISGTGPASGWVTIKLAVTNASSSASGEKELLLRLPPQEAAVALTAAGSAPGFATASAHSPAHSSDPFSAPSITPSSAIRSSSGSPSLAAAAGMKPVEPASVCKEAEVIRIDQPAVEAGAGHTSNAGTPASSAVPPNQVPLPPERKFQQRIANGKKVRIGGLQSEEHQVHNGKNGAILSFDPETGRYAVKVVVLSDKSVGNKDVQNWTVLLLKGENIELHRDQIERDQVSNGDELVLVGASDAKKKLYEVKLDPQYWYDKAIERVLDARNDFEVLDLPVQFIEDMTQLKRAYRKISLAVHPDKNQHPQAADAFRKVYGAFETLMDLRQQRRILWILGKLNKEMEEQVTLEEVEEDELFQWWWEASVPEIEKQVAEFEGQQFDEFGAMWISDGLGGNVEDVQWIGLETAKRLHQEGGAIFIDVRDRGDYAMGHIADAYCTPLPEIIDFGLVNVFMAGSSDLISRLLGNRQKPIIIYSEVATPYSRCRAFCRWLLRAGHHTIKAERLRRLRGGIFGWKHKHGPVARPLDDEIRVWNCGGKYVHNGHHPCCTLHLM